VPHRVLSSVLFTSLMSGHDRPVYVCRKSSPSGPFMLRTTPPCVGPERRNSDSLPMNLRLGSYWLILAVYVIVALIEAVLATRFVLRLLGANPDAGFARFISSLSAVFVTPFLGLFGTPESEGRMLEPQTLVALVVYPLLAWLVAKLIWLAFGASRSATATVADGSPASIREFLDSDAAANKQSGPGTAPARITPRAAPLVSMVDLN
jgi:hypothetical protein